MKNLETAISINKYISNSGFCSRREADRYIDEARVTINNNIALPTDKVYAGDQVHVDGERIKLKQNTQQIYIAFHKPVGITSTTDLTDRSNIISFINHPKRIFPVGRLDKDSSGLILLTSDGDIVNKILRAGNEHEKEYIVTVDKPITPEFVKKMSSGVYILGERTKPCTIKQEGPKRFRIILTQGLNRQIRRMCEALDYKVVSLLRIRIMGITLANIPVGKWRNLTHTELEELKQQLKHSVKTEEASAKKHLMKKLAQKSIAPFKPKHKRD